MKQNSTKNMILSHPEDIEAKIKQKSINHLRDHLKTSTRADRQNASYVCTPSDLLNGPSNGSFMLWMLFCSILALMTFRWRSIMFLVLFCFISVEISEIQLVCDRPTDGPTDRRTDGRTDGPTDRRTDRRSNGRTDLVIEMRARI